MAKITKRGRNPGAVDSWLDTLGLYRKNVAYDETCLFRAVSEQLFDCQVYHERLRKECIVYARENFEEFSHLVESFDEWQEHLNMLEKHMVVCGNIEINIISKKYGHDVTIFDALHQEIHEVTDNDFPLSLRLCLMDEDHYDVVYKREHIMTAGFCQSIIYKILYEKVFNIPNVDEIVKGMLYEKNNIITQAELMAEKRKFAEVNNNEPGLSTLPEETEVDQQELANNNIAPFPFKVAKALDPTIYRNIEYDSWGEVRRELRLGEWYYGDDKLILGTRCILNDNATNEMYDCYIQEIIKNENRCVVYLTKLAEKRTVNYSDLSPENDAKPWPLPYRFSKNLVIAGTPQIPPVEKVTRASKKRNKEKRRSKSCSESSIVVGSEAVENVSAYVGVPLQMHNPNESGYRENEVSTETQTEPLTTEQMITPDLQNAQARYQWEQAHWQQLLPPTPDPMIWPQTPTTTPQNVFNYKPMVASAPVTPDVVPYHDSNFPFYFNYQVDPYQPYSQWSPQHMELQPMQLKTETEKPCEEVSKPQIPENQKTNINFTENENVYEPPTALASSPVRPTVYTNFTPQSTPVEMYSPMMPLPPGTPVIYTSAPPEVTEMVLSSPSVIYTPPVDMQYMSPTQFVYPPTPPAAWYPAGVNSHGFIFPRPQ